MTDLMPDFSDPTHNGTQRPIHIPIRSLMPEPTDAVEYMAMPREMTTFSMPSLPEPGPDTDVAGARDVLDTFVGHMSTWLDQAGDGGTLPALDLAGLPAATLRVLNETLGEGEVSAIVEAGHEVRVQETVFSGVWREQHLNGTHLAAAMPSGAGPWRRRRSGGAIRPRRRHGFMWWGASPARYQKFPTRWAKQPT